MAGMKIIAVIGFIILAAFGIAAQWFRYKSSLRTLRPPKDNPGEPPTNPAR
jgi:hypothetical protein